MQEKTLKSMAYIAAPLLTVALVAGAVSAAEEFEDRFERGDRAEFVAQLTDEQREILEDIHELREEGEFEQARALAEEAGIPKPPHRGGERHEEVKAAVEAGDYEAFVAAIAEAPFADEVDEAFFAQLMEAHALREAGDTEEAKAIMQELGIKPHKHRGERSEAFRAQIEELTDEQRAQFEEARELRQAGDHEGARAIIESLGIEPPERPNR